LFPWVFDTQTVWKITGLNLSLVLGPIISVPSWGLVRYAKVWLPVKPPESNSVSSQDTQVIHVHIKVGKSKISSKVPGDASVLLPRLCCDLWQSCLECGPRTWAISISWVIRKLTEL
jgi:hypothetical protein